MSLGTLRIQAGRLHIFFESARPSVESVDVQPRDSAVEGELILKRGEETILLRIFVSGSGVEPARR